MKHLTALPIVTLVVSLVTACSESSPAAPSATTPDTGSTVIADTGVVETADVDVVPSVVTKFDAKSFELAEGVTIKDGKAYVTLAPLGRILEIAPDGTTRPYAAVPAGYNNGYTLGLAFNAKNELYVAQTLNVADAGAPEPGIYKIPAGGTDGGVVATPFATDAKMVFPNGLVFDAAGGLLVADSATGQILSVTSTGAVATWKVDPELAGSADCKAPLPFPIGVNGIVFTPTEVFVTNTSKGSLLSIGVNSDGSAGSVTTIVKDCKYAGFDGLALDGDTFLVAQNGSPGKVVRVARGGAVTVLVDATPLDGPASVAIATWKGARSALVTNSAFFSVGVDGGVSQPSLMSIPLR